MIGRMFLSGVALVASLLGCGVCAAQDASVLIPSDASAVMRVNSGRILEKMGGDAFIAKVVAAVGESARGKRVVPDEWGIDLGRPIYVTVSKSDNVSATLLMSVADDARFEGAMQELFEAKVQRRGGVSWIGDDNLWVVFDSQYAVMGDADGARDAAWWRDAIKGRKGRGTGPATRGFARMSASDADIVMLASGAVADEDGLAMVRSLYGADLPVGEMSLVWSLSSSDGIAEISYDVVAESDEAARSLEENMAGVRRVGGRYADRIPASSMMVLYGAIDGKRISEMLARSPLLEKDADLAELRRLISTVAGDMALVLGAPVSDGGGIVMPATLMVQVENRALLDFIVAKVGDAPMERCRGGYVVDSGGAKIWMVERGGDMVVSTVEGMASLPEADTPTAVAGCRDGYGGCYLDVGQLMSVAGPLMGMFGAGGEVVSLLSRIESVESFAERPDSVRCTVRLCDGGDNIYLILADAVEILMSAQADAGE